MKAPRPITILAALGAVTACDPSWDAPLEAPEDDLPAQSAPFENVDDLATSLDFSAAATGTPSVQASELVFSPTSVSPAAKPGFPKNNTYTVGQVLAANVLPLQGRVAALSYVGGWLFTTIEQPSSPTGSDLKERIWDLTNPTAPRSFVALAPGQMPNPNFNAHAVLYKEDMVQAGYVLRAPTYGGDLLRLDWSQVTSAGLYHSVGSRGALSYPWNVDNMWSYHPLPEFIKISKRGVVQTDTFKPKVETGIVGHPIVLGNLLLWASVGKEGLAAYDISDPAHPALLDTLPLTLGAYWPEVYGHYVIFAGKSFQVVDFSDPTNLRFVADIPTPDSDSVVYPHCQDYHCFYDTYMIDMRTVESPTPVVKRLGVDANGKALVDGSHWQLPLGNLLVLGGNGNPQGGLSIVAHQAQPDRRGPFVAHHVPADGQVAFPRGGSIQVLVHETLDMRTVSSANIKLRRVGSTIDVPVDLTFSGNGILSIAPKAELEPDASYTVSLVAGGVKDVVGNGMEPYSFSFSTGASSAGNPRPVIGALTVSPAPVAPGATATVQVTATDSNAPLSYRFDFGDGTSTGWGTSASASHPYAQAGHYVVTVQVKDALGALSAKTIGVTAAAAPTAARGSHSNRFATSGGRLFVVNGDNSTMTGLGLDTMAVAVPEVAVAANPRSIAAAADGSLWLTARDADRIEIRSTAGAALASITLPYGSAPEGIAMSPDRQMAFVTLAGAGKLLRIDTTTRAITSSLELGPSAGALAVSGDGKRVLVARLVSPQHRGEIWDVANGVGLTLTRTIPLLPSRGFGSEVEFTEPDRAENGRGVPNYLTSITLSPDGKTAWVTGKKDNVFRGLVAGGVLHWKANVGFRDLLVTPADLDADKTVRSIVCTIDLASGQERQDERRDLDNSEGPSATAFSGFGDYAFVALRGNNAVLVIDTLTKSTPLLIGLHSSRGRYQVGGAPRALFFDEARKRLWVYNDTTRSVSVLGAGALVARGEPLTTLRASVPVSGGVFEKLTPAQLAGKQLFYDAEGKVANPDGGDPILRISSEGYLSCASCHLDGGSDERVWDFSGRGEGLRNTISLLGRAGMAMGRVHWTANFDEIQDFENDLRNAFGGAGLMSDAAFAASSDPLGAKKAGRSTPLDALAAYVASLGTAKLGKSPYRNSDGTMTAAALRGKQVFQAQGCATCHAGTLLTDSPLATLKLRNVGTLGTFSGKRRGLALAGIDTPTLFGLWDSAPYLHDGAAASLADVFSHVGGQVLAAESGQLSGAAGVGISRTARGAKMVRLRDAAARVTFSAVDGGSGGPGRVTVRYAANASRAITVTVNGATVTVPNSTTVTAEGAAGYRSVSVPVAMTAGATNTIAVGWNGSYYLDLDDVMVGTANQMAAAVVHRKVPEASRADLVQYLLELDRP